MTQTATTLRSAAREMVADECLEASRLSHIRNYHKLHIRRDGTVSWFESINQSDDIIDDGAAHFAAVPSVVTVGTGGCACNCDHCEDEGYDTIADAIADAVCEGGDAYSEDMLAAFDAITDGYFDDEVAR